MHQFASTQPRAVAEVDQEAKPLGRARLPTVRPLQPLGDRPHELPLTLGKRSRRVQGRLPGASDLDAREGVGQHIPLLDQPPEHRAQHGQRIGSGARGQPAGERPPLGRSARRRRPHPTLPGRGLSQEGPIRHGILGGQRGQCDAALDDGPQDQPFGFLAVGPLRCRRFVQRQPSLDRLVVVVRPQDARRARRTMQAHAAVDLAWNDELLPGNHLRWRCGDQ